MMQAMKNQRVNLRPILLLLVSSVSVLLLNGCVPSPDEGNITTEIELPIDSRLNLYCDNAGIYDEVCILEDPENPYSMVDVNDDTKWVLNSKLGHSMHKARFYLWATALAINPSGENQYYTADSLNKIYTINGDEILKLQAQKAYRSVLDNFFDSVTWLLDEGSTEPDIYYALPLADLVGNVLYNPEAGLSLLYQDQVSVLAVINSWGYYYDKDNKVMSTIE